MRYDELCNKITNAIFKPIDVNKKQFYVLGSEEYLSNVVFNNGLDIDNFPFIIPFIDRENLSIIDRKTKKDIENKFGIYSELDWQCNTITNVFLEKLLGKLFDVMYTSRCSKLILDFYKLFNINLSNKVSTYSEKEGNINVSFEFKDTNDNLISHIFDFCSHKHNELYRQIDSETQVELVNNFGIIISDTWVSTAISYTFLKNIPELLINDINNKSSSINFNDILEFHTNKNMDKKCYMRPGMNAKLLVKSDELTEYDYDED